MCIVTCLKITLTLQYNIIVSIKHLMWTSRIFKEYTEFLYFLIPVKILYFIVLAYTLSKSLEKELEHKTSSACYF